MLSRTQVKSIRSAVAAEGTELTQAFNALSDPGRFRIFKLLVQENGLCVTDVAHVLDISVPAASQQLKIIELSGLVNKARNGQKICYSVKLESSLVRAMVKLVDTFG